MGRLATFLARQRVYLAVAAAACLCALVLSAFPGIRALPVLGPIPLLPTCLLAALIGLPLLVLLQNRGLAGDDRGPIGWRPLAGLLALGFLLALPPIAIDLFLPFPRGLNLPLPGALAFYPAIALVAEVQFHLVPLAVLALVLPRRLHPLWKLAPVVFVEPAFQAAFLSGAALQGWLVVGNVALISAVQLWLFRRHGFGAMIGLRLAFYLFWHILWGTLRIALLFPG